MNIEKYRAGGKSVTLYHADKEYMPLVVLNTYTGDGASVVKAMEAIRVPDCNLLVVGDLNWDHDMTPWFCPPLSENDTPCTGGADEYLYLLVNEIIPGAKEHIKGMPSHIAIAGYSLAGLFAIYAMYQTDIFDCAASMSGSLWFPDFKDYCLRHEMKKQPEKLYLSLGDREAKTRNRTLMTVQENTEALIKHYRRLGIDVTWELNPGNHFKDAAIRSAKGIIAII